MGKKWQLVFCGVIALIVLFAVITITKDGSKTICPECGKTIIDSTKMHIVLRAEAGKYSVQTSNELCDNCGVMVQTGTQLKCPNCRTISPGRVETIKVKRGTEENYFVTTIESICYTCEQKIFSDPDQVATMFTDAINQKNIDEAIKYCDPDGVTVYNCLGVFQDTGSPRVVCKALIDEMLNRGGLYSNYRPSWTKNVPFFLIAEKNGNNYNGWSLSLKQPYGSNFYKIFYIESFSGR